MKCISSLLSFMAAIQLLDGKFLNEHIEPNRRSNRSTPIDTASDDIDTDHAKTPNQLPELYPCFTAEQRSVRDQCFLLVSKMHSTNYIQSMSDCIDSTEITDTDSSIKATCESGFYKQTFITYADCYFSRIGAMKQMKPELLKAATIDSSNLNDVQKAAAAADFDACMAQLTANHSRPYSFYGFRSDKNPAILDDYVRLFRKKLNLGALSPTAQVVAIDCMQSALLHNGCAPTSQETATALTQLFDVSGQPSYMEHKLLQCMNEDYHWFHDLCGATAGSQLATKWIQNCTRGNAPTGSMAQTEEMNTNDNSCRVQRMKQILELTADCLVQKQKAVSFSDFTKKVSHPSIYIGAVIDQAQLSDQQKTATVASFDACMAHNFTLPHRNFPYELQRIPGRPIFQAIAAFINAALSIGNLRPTHQMSIVDCATTALLLNGCHLRTPAEIAVDVFISWVAIENKFDVLDRN